MKKICVLFFLIIFLSTGAFAGTVNLPKTGQTKCYDTAGIEIPCTGTGQDGEILAGVAWPNPRFKDNGDGTITDNLTGLMWSKNANPFNRAMTWQWALENCNNNITLGGYTDWRLPNVNELESLVNANEANGRTWLNAQGFTNVQGGWYWSSATVAYYPDEAWVVDMYSGDVDVDGKCSNGFCQSNYVWPVRAGQTGSLENSVISLPQTGQTKCWDQDGNEIPCAGTGQDGDVQAGMAWPSPRFTDQGDGTVTDNLTGLMWTKNAGLLRSWCNSTWQQALDSVKGMNAGTYENFGYADWRLPNRKEMYSLTDFSRYGPALPAGNPFTNTGGGDYWSSTTSAYYPNTAWVVGEWDGEVYRDDKSYTCRYPWAVRGGQSGPLGDLDISVTKTDSPDPVTVGSNLTYTITVTNNGPKTGTGVTLTDTLPSSVTYVSATSTKGTPTKSGNTVTCSIGKLTNGSSATVTIIVKPTTAGTITNTASATCNETDTNSGNNTATVTTTVNAVPTGCSTWNDVIGKYNAYVGGQATWGDVINCYNQYVSP
jgi:uncharacterized repeat protein (TIGR01451 family)